MTSVKIRRGTNKDVQFSNQLISVPTGTGLPTVEELWDEITTYIDILLGRIDPPIDSPYLLLMEVSTAYYARALEIDALIHHEEREMRVLKGSGYYKFRTGELRDFIELAKKTAELGSRRLTQEQILAEQRRSI